MSKCCFCEKVECPFNVTDELIAKKLCISKRCQAYATSQFQESCQKLRDISQESDNLHKFLLAINEEYDHIPHKISVFDLIGDKGFDDIQGKKVYEAIFRSLRKYETVIVDFQNVRFLCSNFMDYALGFLLSHMSLGDFYRRVQLKNLSNNKREAIDKTVQESDLFYNQRELYEMRDKCRMEELFAFNKTQTDQEILQKELDKKENKE